jgi:hypothetical protein
VWQRRPIARREALAAVAKQLRWPVSTLRNILQRGQLGRQAAKSRTRIDVATREPKLLSPAIIKKLKLNTPLRTVERWRQLLRKQFRSKKLEEKMIWQVLLGNEFFNRLFDSSQQDPIQ